MPSPISQIGYTKLSELEIQFTSLSLNTNESTTYRWDFGDGSVSTDQNPLYTYAAANIYTVALEVSDGVNTHISSFNLNLSGSVPNNMFTNIPLLVDLYCPSVIIGPVINHQQKEFLIAKWQLYLQPLVINPSVELINTHISENWPPLVNSLIAKLVVIDIIEMEAASFLLNISGSAANSSINNNTQSNTNVAPGPVKSIETGPTKVERFENKDSSSTSEMVSNLAKAYQYLINPGGVLSQLKITACQESKRLQIFLPMCGALPNKVIPIKIGKNCKGGYNANPFGITDRMT